MFALNEERNAHVRSMRDCAFHYTTFSECIEYVIGVTCLYYCIMHLNTSIYIRTSLSLSLHEIYFLKMLHIIRSNLKLHTYSSVFFPSLSDPINLKYRGLLLHLHRYIIFRINLSAIFLPYLIYFTM